MNKKLLVLSLLSAALLYSCEFSGTKKKTTETDYIAVGKNITTEAQSVLGKNLMEAIKTGGTEYALEFCNIKAIPLTDSMALLLDAGIKRVTDKPRNPGNLSNERELAYINLQKDKLALGESPQAVINEINGKMVGYYPIVTNNMCLQCHGKKDADINPATLQKISEIYAEDKATGYGENELRGLWVIEFNKK